jgi:hypothetical protein
MHVSYLSTALDVLAVSGAISVVKSNLTCCFVPSIPILGGAASLTGPWVARQADNLLGT